MAKIRKGDTVQVISGKDKGLTGTVLVVYPDSDRVLVEGVNRVKRHTKVGQSQPRRQDRRDRHPGGRDPHLERHAGRSRTRRRPAWASRKQVVDKTRPDGSTYQAERNVRIARRSGEDI